MELTTISGIKIKVAANKSKRTYTIRREGSKYRTLPMSKEEFKNCEYWSGSDWQQFLHGQSYYKIY